MQRIYAAVIIMLLVSSVLGAEVVGDADKFGRIGGVVIDRQTKQPLFFSAVILLLQGQEAVRC